MIADEITATVKALVKRFASGRDWRTSREYRLGRFAETTKRGSWRSRRGDIDLAIHGPWEHPLLVEIDRTDKSRSLDKLRIGAAWGHQAVWIRWGGPRMQVPRPIPDGVHLIKLVIPDAKDWDPGRTRTRAHTRTPLEEHQIPSAVTVTRVDPSTLMTPEERKARDERVAERRTQKAEQRQARKARRKSEGRTRGTPVNPRSRTSIDRGRGWEFPTNPAGDGQTREIHNNDLQQERDKLDKKVAAYRRQKSRE